MMCRQYEEVSRASLGEKVQFSFLDLLPLEVVEERCELVADLQLIRVGTLKGQIDGGLLSSQVRCP